MKRDMCIRKGKLAARGEEIERERIITCEAISFMIEFSFSPKTNNSADCFQYHAHGIIYSKRYTRWMRSGDKTR